MHKMYEENIMFMCTFFSIQKQISLKVPNSQQKSDQIKGCG